MNLSKLTLENLKSVVDGPVNLTPMKLNDLLIQITPLPWETGCLRTRVEILPPGWNAPMLVADCHGKHAPESEDERVANAAYLTHAANVLPELVKALEEICPDEYTINTGFSPKKMRAILARANEIKV